MGTATGYLLSGVPLGVELAYCEDQTGTPTPIPTNSTPGYVNHMAITVPASPDRAVEIRGCANLQVTAAGAGGIVLVVAEITSGSAVLLTSTGGGVSGSFTTGAGSQYVPVPDLVKKLGPTTTERQFIFGALMIRDAASALAASVRSSSSGGVHPAWFGAYAL